MIAGSGSVIADVIPLNNTRLQMAYCPNCKSEIESYASVCTACAYDFPDRRPYIDDSPYQFNLKIFLMLVAMVSVGVSIFYAVFIGPSRATEALRDRTRRLNGEMHVRKKFSIISFKNLPITDGDLAPLVPLMRKCPNLIGVDLSGTLITDESIELLDTLPEALQSRVNLDGTAVTDSGKMRVGGLPLTDPELIDALNRLSESSN